MYLTYDEVSEIASYNGFPVRYPHWKFGMEYEELCRGYEVDAAKKARLIEKCRKWGKIFSGKLVLRSIFDPWEISQEEMNLEATSASMLVGDFCDGRETNDCLAKRPPVSDGKEDGPGRTCGPG